MSFATDVAATPLFGETFRMGLGALEATDKTHITVGASVKLAGSVNVDLALKPSQPNAARWDYVIGQKRGNAEYLHWVEVHPASGGGNIGEMQTKLNWLKSWMGSTPLDAYPRQVVWIASGSSAFNSRSPAIRKLANQGLVFVGNHLTLKP